MEASETQDMKVQYVKVHSQRNCFALSHDEMKRIQDEVSVSIPLETGIHLIKLRPNQTKTEAADTGREPSVLLWIYGGPVINRSTDAEVTATWASLQGYEDVLALDVKNRANLCALFLDSHPSQGQLSLSVAKI